MTIKAYENGNSPAHPSIEWAEEPESGAQVVTKYHKGLTKFETFVLYAMQGLMSNVEYSARSSDDIACRALEVATDCLEHTQRRSDFYEE